MPEKRSGRPSIRRPSSWSKRRSLSVMAKKSLIQPQAIRSNRIRINVGGIVHETYRSTLKAIPDTRLAWLTETTSTSSADYDPISDEYFFDRHPGMFSMILNYYRTGKLHVPVDVCGPIFEEELAFWGIEEDQIESCCWMTYRSHRDAQETLKELNIQSDDNGTEEENAELNRYIKERFGIEAADHDDVSQNCWERYRPKVWTLLEEPNSSRGAKVIAMVSLLFVLISVTTFCLESVAELRIPLNQSDPISHDWTTWEKNTKSKPVDAIVILDYVCVFFFTVEFIIRLVFSDDKRRFFTSPLNWIEISAVVPFYVERLVIAINPDLEYNIYMQVVKTMRLIRIFRVFKLTRHFSGLKILWKAIKASAKELTLLIVFLFISVLIFACLVYYAESVDESPQNDFKNIPLGFWWAVVTMTTLGYGDMYPRTGLGYVIGVICSISGVLVLALPVPVIVNNFSLYYSHAQAQMKLPKKHKRILAGAPDDLKVGGSLDEERDCDEDAGDGDEDDEDDTRCRDMSSNCSRCNDSKPEGTCGNVARNKVSKGLSDSTLAGYVVGDESQTAESRRHINVTYVDETIYRSRSKMRTFKRKVSPIPESPPRTPNNTPATRNKLTTQASCSDINVTGITGINPKGNQHETTVNGRNALFYTKADLNKFHQKIKDNRTIRVTFIDNDVTLSSSSNSLGSSSYQQTGIHQGNQSQSKEQTMANGDLKKEINCPQS
ncbi:hypothetical protein LSH36_20g06035 [Paralvinella palmiformis]|uniref:BTB domain-containing protein n=1 Tax=Paralvinella palmiformis TaxID=53620 RepID=A0AAD9NI86_9ANNE|nr:hypothetical protein LSH36_20g06035 [Paralvinella palmiformis]